MLSWRDQKAPTGIQKAKKAPKGKPRHPESLKRQVDDSCEGYGKRPAEDLDEKADWGSGCEMGERSSVRI
ncbi:hypothetical protein K491DRAFT_692541 [Lophiostoma macrostomum CBS 122681]|uniref:Uncharacterized protein n=1 Tax=Lophiostoma macrostomum CBS 122681 TaxID=1314788 RepID=A0A6A6TAF6_9PLEO|nr:hypothetical protein K491DRAFT_692541 [Lophiostoma macrostomum CBS 122681]